MDSRKALLNLFQVTDSLFPSGAFAYSWGLETYVSEGLIKDRNGLKSFLEAYLSGVIKRCDALIVKLSYEASEREDINTAFRLDRLIHSMKLAREPREGSVQTGRQLLNVMRGLHKSTLLEHLAEGIRDGKALGHHPVVFGLVCSVIENRKDEAVIAYLYQTVSGIVSAGLRLIPLGHMDGQRVIEEIKPLLIKIVDDVALLNEDDISTFSPGIEIRAMRHEHLYTRLFKA
jgi:urease accessory protein